MVSYLHTQLVLILAAVYPKIFFSNHIMNLLIRKGKHMAYFAPYIDASGIHMPTYEDRLLGAYGDGSAAVTYETGI